MPWDIRRQGGMVLRRQAGRIDARSRWLSCHSSRSDSTSEGALRGRGLERRERHDDEIEYTTDLEHDGRDFRGRRASRN